MNSRREIIFKSMYILIAAIMIGAIGYANAASQSERLRAIEIYEQITSPPSKNMQAAETIQSEKMSAIRLYEYITSA